MNNIDIDKSREISDSINKLINMALEMKNHYKMLFSDNIITSGEYYLKMDKLKELRTDLIKNENILSLIEEFGISILHLKLDNVKNKLQQIKDEMSTLIKENGYTSIIEILDIFSIKKSEKGEILKRLGLINNLFIVTNFKDYIDDSVKNEEKINAEKKGLDFLMENDCKELTVYETDNVLYKLKNCLKKKSIKIEILNEFYKKEKDTKKINEFIKTTDGEISLKNNFINLIYELNKASIKIEIGDNLYIFSGYFKEDIFNEIYLNDAFEGKYLEIINYYNKKDNKPNNYDKYKIFIKEYMNQYSVKDFIIKDIEKIIEELENEYNQNIEISKKVIQELVDILLSSNIYNKRQLIIHGLINDNCRKKDDESVEENTYDYNSEIKLDINIKYDHMKDIKYTKLKDQKKPKKGEKLSAYMISPKIQNVKMNKATASRFAINSLMINMDGNNGIEVLVYNSNKTINSNILLDFLRNNVLKGGEFNMLRKSIHYNLRKKIFIKDNEKNSDKTKEEISWEMKLETLDLSESEKGKVMEKIKEFRNGKENTKAENYIDNFFQIPFGKYIKEDIFSKCIESNEKINKYLKMLNDNENNECEIYMNDTIENLVLKQKKITKDYAPEILGHFMNERDNIKKIRKHYLGYVGQVLDNAIYGHTDSKRQIKREIGKWLSSGKTEGMILGFHGPPGVGKTTLARQGISKCLVDNDGNYRPFNMIQLGGQNDGSTFSGHNYTYVGSKPGDLIEALKKSKCMNPILFFDELDKVSDDVKGKDIISILIHLTDKSQNSEMHDKFFSGINFDFSKCIIIFSYNDRNLINKTLRDRITEIKVEPLKTYEKIEIIKGYTMKDLEERLNFPCNMNDNLIRYVAETYTMEAGVRKLNERIEEIFSELNLKELENDKFDTVELNENKIDLILDRHTKILRNSIHNKSKPGFVNGLYATTIGFGGITLIQTDKRRMTDKKDLDIKVTGKLGDVMKESVDCAKTIALNFLTKEEHAALKKDIENEPFSLHIHCPDAAVPKDGPSAGSTITLAIYSFLSKKNVRNDVAMTGEIDLYGKIKAIGGLSEKLNGAIKAGVKKVLFPKENEEDYKKIIRKNLLDGKIECIMVSHFSEILEEALEK